MAGEKEILNLADSRTKLIAKLWDRLEGAVQQSQRDLLKTVIDDFLDGLEMDEAGQIKNTLANKRRLSMFDQVYRRYANNSGLEIVKGITDGVGQIVDFNQNYFTAFYKPAQLTPIQSNVQETLSAWLGLTTRGNVAPNGYLDTLIQDATVKNQIKNLLMKSTASQAGFFETKKVLQLHIEGNADQTGALQKYYRNLTFDLYSVVDRTTSRTYADKLKLNYAIYEGGLIDTSRAFCKKRNGKVFSREEIAAFDPKEARPPAYDPFTDLGGYGCRHHLNFIPDPVAFSMRPELRPAN